MAPIDCSTGFTSYAGSTESKLIRKYFTQDLSLDEKKSYLEYINGNTNSIDWIEKASLRREPLLLAELKCTMCNTYVNVKENGICRCSNGHECYDVVMPIIYYAV